MGTKIIDGNLQVNGNVSATTGITPLNVFELNLNNYLSATDVQSIIFGSYNNGDTYTLSPTVIIDFDVYDVVKITVSGNYSGVDYEKVMYLYKSYSTLAGDRMYVGVIYGVRSYIRPIQTTYSLRTVRGTNEFTHIDIGKNSDNLKLVCTDLLLTNTGNFNHLLIKNIMLAKDINDLVNDINSMISTLEQNVGGVSYGRISNYDATEINNVLTAIRTQTNNATAKSLFGKIALYLFKHITKVSGYIDHVDSGAIAIADLTTTQNDELFSVNYLSTATVNNYVTYIRAQTSVDAANCSFNSIVIKE